MALEFWVELASHLVHRGTGIDLSERYYLDPVYRLEQDRLAAAWARNCYPEFNVVIESGEFSVDEPLAIRIGGLQPYLIVSALFGAKIRFWGDHEPSIDEEPLKHVDQLDTIKVPDVESHPLIQDLLSQVREMRSSYANQYAIYPPFFWDDSGWAFTHAPFTSAYKLRGEVFFEELYTNPRGIRHLLGVVSEVTCRLIDLFADVGGRQVSGIHLGDCAASLVSAKHYSEFAIPSLEYMMDRYGPGRLHSCGSSTHLLPALKDVRGICEFHLGWDTDLEAARDQLGDPPIAYLVPPKFLMQDSDKVENQMRTAIEANMGKPLTWWQTIDRGIPEANMKLAYEIWKEVTGRTDRISEEFEESTSIN